MSERRVSNSRNGGKLHQRYFKYRCEITVWAELVRRLSLVKNGGIDRQILRYGPTRPNSKLLSRAFRRINLSNLRLTLTFELSMASAASGGR